ncbi:exodeoxyribonuclease V subunit beta [Buchnera aphidicola]|uniref:RecBCD enzyme subunit RecB n=1 Tax=Buchnera aphidicola (Aphis nerii) TaxID=1241835 RepID=A0A4D6XQM6_9GAMM|nr:exodeoxyribonuclease V subunit beta [Buchnera aphidicola]QCI18976.1 exodeoxyribonuclease V subunit beta [Buchnera aphidicola (Aphis nerii)]
MKKKLNIFNIPFNNINLIEASAGTGKTTAIVLMYLRLLLGIGNKKNTKPLLVQEILIVTFTNFAKEEIHKRIKKNIEQLYSFCITKKTNNLILKPFLEKIKNIEETICILEKAKRNINHMSIYTIHGFCKDILQLYFLNVNKEIIKNEELLFLQSIEDFWRSYFYKLPEKIINIISQYYKNPESLLTELKPIFNCSKVYFTEKFNKNNNDIIKYHEKNIQIINIFKKKWLCYNVVILNLIEQLKPNKKIYNESNISRWIKNITNWAKSETENYQIPTSLKYFSKEIIIKNIKNQKIPYHIFFENIEEILKKKLSLKNIILFQAIKKITKILKKEKKKKLLLGFNDLLDTLLKHIKKEKELRKIIIKKYPVAFIDEFQDTDIKQYQIFNILYKINNKNTALFLIGDPKQSIYSFRGADIFSYLNAKSKIKNHYYLDTNWRSASNICKFINYLFSRNKYPFFFKNISFENIVSCNNKNMQFKIRGIIQKSISFFFKKKEKTYIEEYQDWIAKQCANEICYWLTCAKKGEATLINQNTETVLKASDIVILVRNKKEAGIIKNALKKVNIQSFYSSSNKNIFQTNDAYELLIILQSILQPTNIQLLKQSIFTHIFYQILLEGEKEINKKTSHFIVNKLYEYRNIWKNIGIFCTIKNIILDYQKYSKNSDKFQYYQKNINFLHIAELLEKQATYFHQKSSLVRWLEKKISEKKDISEDENIRYFKQSEVIKIITIHKSKGLEYPIVWIPFAGTYKKSKLYLYHDKKTFKMFFDLSQNKETQKIVENERLSEDLRFLYVAITRSIYHCCLGMGDVINKKNQKKNKNHKSALGYIIQRGCYMDYNSLLKEINLLNIKSYIAIKYDSMNIDRPYIKKNIYLLSPPEFLIKKPQNYFQITSFTKLKKESICLDQNQNFNINNIFDYKENNKKEIIFKNFPKGKKSGILIHYILNKINFIKKLNINFFYQVLKKYEFSEEWAPILMSWINNIINVKFKKINFNLSMLKPNQYIKEMNFFLPIQKTLNSIDLNKIIQSFDPISSLTPKFSFNPINGILKGSIDLVFLWNKKYYIIDYKSNYLGDDKNYYSSKNIKKEIIKNRYDLQYQIYTVALHQYLNKKIKKYSYEDNFGGIFYMFLRGIDNINKTNSIFYTMPNYLLIKHLIDLLIIKN